MVPKLFKAVILVVEIKKSTATETKNSDCGSYEAT